MRFSPTHAPPMANTYASKCSYIDLAAAHFAAGNDSTTALIGAGTTAPVGSAAALLA